MREVCSHTGMADAFVGGIFALATAVVAQLLIGRWERKRFEQELSDRRRLAADDRLQREADARRGLLAQGAGVLAEVQALLEDASPDVFIYSRNEVGEGQRLLHLVQQGHRTLRPRLLTFALSHPEPEFRWSCVDLSRKVNGVVYQCLVLEAHLSEEGGVPEDAQQVARDVFTSTWDSAEDLQSRLVD